jgi:hypothetical protein
VISPFARYRPADARGRLIRLFRLKERKGLPWRTRMAINHANPWMTHVWLIQAVYWLAVLGVFAYFRARALRGLAPYPVTAGDKLPLIVRRGLLIPLGSVLVWVLLRMVRPWLGMRAVRACLRSEVCPNCAYRIHGIPAEPDGCTVCPECGAAWRMP